MLHGRRAENRVTKVIAGMKVGGRIHGKNKTVSSLEKDGGFAVNSIKSR